LLSGVSCVALLFVFRTRILCSTNSVYLLTVSYIPPSSSFDLYKAHVDNIAHLYQELKDGQYICVLGDFNLSSLVWAHDLESSTMVSSNLHLPHEILVIDELLSMGLVQINHVFSNLNKLLDLIFVHPDVCLTLCCSDNPLAACDAHHKPLLILITCYIFSLPDDVLKLLLNPNILWQCNSCVVANGSHSKIDEFDDKLKALERLYQGLHNKFLEAFLLKMLH